MKDKKSFFSRFVGNIFLVTVLLIPVLFLVCAIVPFISSFDYCAYPSDYYLDYQWSIDKVNLEKAWRICTGSEKVKVGVIDSGIDGEHIDLEDNINASLSCAFNSNLNTGLEDLLGHGTHVAGIIGASGNNNCGIAGACWSVDLVSLRVAQSNGMGVDASLLDDAVNYATLNNIPILNMSIAGPYFDFDLFDAIFDYPGLVICAAGNSALNLDGNHGIQMYPVCFLGNNIIAVGNSTENDTKASDSNYGSLSVDLFAPGKSIISTIPNDGYDTYSGTSMSSPLVAGVAALLLSIDPSLSTAQIRNAILSGVDYCSSLSNYCVTGGRLNAYNAALNVVPVIPQQSTSESFSFNSLYPKYLRIECPSAHYTLSFSASSFYRITIYTDINSTPLYTNEFYNNSINTVSFVTKQYEDIFVKIENLSNVRGIFNANISNVSSHSFNTHIYFDSNYHKSRCSCGAFVLNSHVYNGLSPNCLLCESTPLTDNDNNSCFEEDLCPSILDTRIV